VDEVETRIDDTHVIVGGFASRGRQVKSSHHRLRQIQRQMLSTQLKVGSFVAPGVQKSYRILKDGLLQYPMESQVVV
jgi:hypothetical protein